MRLLTLVLPLALPASAQQYEVFLLDDTDLLVAEFPNDLGTDQVVVGSGKVTPNGPNRAVAWRDGAATILATPPGHEDASARDWSAAGFAVGWSIDEESPRWRAVLWREEVPFPVSSLVVSGPAYELIAASGTNDAGWIVGWGVDPAFPGEHRGWLLRDGTLVDLGSIDPPGFVHAFEVNESGTVIGAAAVGGHAHAFRWRAGTLVDLHALAGVAGDSSVPYDVNEHDVVVGFAEVGGPFSQTACVWDGDVFSTLGTFGGNGTSYAYGVNDPGDVVGESNARAILWRGGKLLDLNDLVPASSGWFLRAATDIDAQGRIVGSGTFGGETRGFRLEPFCASCAPECAATPNSTGAPAEIGAVGWESISAGYMTLVAGPAPAGEPGLFFYGSAATQVPFGDGFLCVRGPEGIFRLPAGAVDAGGELTHALDFDALPAGGEIVAGDTWHLQAWFRDAAAGGSGWNTSDAMSVTFLP